MFPFSKKKEFFTAEENQQIVAAIQRCEKTTSGEIRVFVESKNPMMEPLDRAAEIFWNLKMQLTHHRNAVLLYVAVKDREVALFGDSGIHEQVGSAYWDKEVKLMLEKFRNNDLAEGIIQCLLHVGGTLSEKFPYHSTEDKNELPDTIVFGK